MIKYAGFDGQVLIKAGKTVVMWEFVVLFLTRYVCTAGC